MDRIKQFQGTDRSVVTSCEYDTGPSNSAQVKNSVREDSLTNTLES